MLPLVPFLTDPNAHGIDGPAFDVVIPSLPGYGFSERPRQVGVNYQHVAGLWHRLMRGLGYERGARRRFRSRDCHVHGVEQSKTNDWRTPE
jgi:pimeloyl-ACP methyl ester carboxylesterase